MADREHTPGPIERHLSEHHVRLEGLLAQAERGAEVDAAAYGAFRAGLLRHIALEEKLLFAALRAAGREPAALVRRLRIDHGAIAALLVPPPSLAVAAELRSILSPHDRLEEGPEGLYAQCDAALGEADAAALVERMRAYPPVRAAAHADGPRVLRTAAEALRLSARRFE